MPSSCGTELGIMGRGLPAGNLLLIILPATNPRGDLLFLVWRASDLLLFVPPAANLLFFIPPAANLLFLVPR